MASESYVDLDMNGNEILAAKLVNPRLEVLSVAPTNPALGQTYIHSDDGLTGSLQFWNGSGWETSVGAPGPEGPPGSSSSVFEYNLSISNTPPPGTAKIATNATGAEASTALYIAYSPVGTTGSYAPLLRSISPGDGLLVTDKVDESKYAEWIATGDVIDYPAQDYVEVPVAYVDHAGQAIGKSGQNVFLFLEKAGVPGPPGPTGLSTTDVVEQTESGEITDRIWMMNSPSATTVTLPASTQGKLHTIKNIGAGLVTMASTGGETIDTVAADTITIPQWAARTFLGHNGNWYLV